MRLLPVFQMLTNGVAVPNAKQRSLPCWDGDGMNIKLQAGLNRSLFLMLQGSTQPHRQPRLQLCLPARPKGKRLPEWLVLGLK